MLVVSMVMSPPIEFRMLTHPHRAGRSMAEVDGAAY